MVAVQRLKFACGIAASRGIGGSLTNCASRTIDAERWEVCGGCTVVTLRGSRPGPTVALLGGVHGDENEGVLAVRQVLHQAVQGDIAGTLHAVAPANPNAWSARSRASAIDGRDLARCFPGSRDGSYTERLAAELAERIIYTADLLIDLHSAGQLYTMPLFCGFCRGGSAAELCGRAAVAFGAPLVWAHDHVAPGRSLAAAAESGVPAIYAECGGGGSIKPGDLTAYVRGVLGVLATWGVITGVPVDNKLSPARWVYGDGDLDQGIVAYVDGFFTSKVQAGATVGAGDEIGVQYNDQGVVSRVLRAPQDGIVMFLRRQARVEAGDVLFVLADMTDPKE